MSKFIIMLTILMLSTKVSACPSYCSCTLTIARCTNLGSDLSSIPGDIMELEITMSNIPALHHNLLYKFNKLQTLKITDSNLNAISYDSFLFVEKTLENLDLSNNNISILFSGSFRHLPNLKSLNLNGNMLRTTLPEDLFSDLSNLKSLRLGKTNVILKPEDLKYLRDLTMLDLGNNNIRELPGSMFSRLRKLEMLILKGNKLTYFDEGVLSGLQNLDVLDLSENSLSSVGPFNSRATLRMLDVSSNSIQKLQKENFKGLYKLEKLMLSSNQLKNIQSNEINGLKKLKEISLQSNKITEISPDAFDKLPALEDIDLNKNYLQTVPEQLFAYSDKIRSIKLSNNEISCNCETSSSFRSLPSRANVLGNCAKPSNLSSSTLMKFKRDNDPCFGRGACSDDLTKCECELGYGGDYCEMDLDPCLTVQCKNDGVCMSSDKDFTCKCSFNFYGKYCEKMNPCLSSQCKNGATCNPKNDTYSCECAEYYQGVFCENYRPCLTVKCENDGLCVTKDKSYFCQCKSGYYGKMCQNYDPCESKPCKNNGKCFSTSETNVTCQCPGRYLGAFCEVERPSVGSAESVANTIHFNKYFLLMNVIALILYLTF